MRKNCKLDKKSEYKFDLRNSKPKTQKSQITARNCSSNYASSKSYSTDIDVSKTDGLMNASISNENPITPHLTGGEIFMQQWEVINCGKLPWTINVSLITK